MHREEQDVLVLGEDVLVLGELQKRHAQHQVGREVEAGFGFFTREVLHLLFTVRGRRQVDSANGERPDRADDLHGLSILGAVDGTQDLVALDDGVYGTL